MKTGEIMPMDEKFAKWKGLDRSTIKWNQTINEKNCTGCGMCITSCGRNVFDFDKEKKLAENGIEPETITEMIKNIKQYGNPFGEIKEGKMPKELCCC